MLPTRPAEVIFFPVFATADDSEEAVAQALAEMKRDAAIMKS